MKPIAQVRRAIMTNSVAPTSMWLVWYVIWRLSQATDCLSPIHKQSYSKTRNQQIDLAVVQFGRVMAVSSTAQ